MNTALKIILTLSCIFLAAGTGVAQENLWEKDFVLALQKGKIQNTSSSEGLGYTPLESSVLENALKKALEQKAPPCEAMKIAVDLKYRPYDILTNIFNHGSEVNLNQLCMCATETGINKQIVAQAASQAVTPVGEPVFPRDEIAQAQCLREIGLGYTALAAAPDPIDPPEKPKPFSQSNAGE